MVLQAHTCSADWDLLYLDLPQHLADYLLASHSKKDNVTLSPFLSMNSLSLSVESVCKCFKTSSLLPLARLALDIPCLLMFLP